MLKELKQKLTKEEQIAWEETKKNNYKKRVLFSLTAMMATLLLAKSHGWKLNQKSPYHMMTISIYNI